MPNYQQESKNKVRELMLRNAISALTSERYSSQLIAHDELKVTFDHFLDLIECALKSEQKFKEIQDAALRELNEWFEYDKGNSVKREASSLKVLYLCGPSPTNDLGVLLEAGVNIHNIWAITGSAKDSKAAHKELYSFNLELKIHHGSLANFFESYNEVFDLIYFDACGPFLGGKPSTLPPLMAILGKQRLAPMGALITNYSAPPEEGSARQRYVDLATAYFHPRYNDLPDVVRKSQLDPEDFAIDPDILREFTAINLEPIYSDLITCLTVDLAGSILPSLRAFSMPAFLKKHTSDTETTGSLVEHQAGDGLDEQGFPGDRWLSPSSYPILSFISRLEEYKVDDPLITALRSYNQQGMSYKHLVSVSELTRSVVEDNWKVVSTELLSAIQCSWFDYDARLTCDAPLPNLLIDTLVGTYGRPYFYNPKLSKRVKYTSNVREMHCDLFVFDQCRSFFEWFPTVQACPSRFRSITFQIVARCLMDRIHWANFYNTAKSFKWAAIGSIGECKTSVPVSMPLREDY
jgi:hypothetical protein